MVLANTLAPSRWRSNNCKDDFVGRSTIAGYRKDTCAENAAGYEQRVDGIISKSNSSRAVNCNTGNNSAESEVGVVACTAYANRNVARDHGVLFKKPLASTDRFDLIKIPPVPIA